MHVVTFTDATLVSFSWQHTFTDGMGRAALMRAWCLVLAGKENEVPTFIGGGQEDPLAEFGRVKPAEDYVLAGHNLTGVSMLIFGLRWIVPKVWWGEPTSRVICISSRFFQGLKERVTAEIQATEPGAFVSDGDVLTAWISRLYARSIRTPQDRSVVVYNMIDLRGRLTSTFQSGCAYVQNALIGAFAIIPAGRVTEGLLGPVAVEIRRAIREQLTEDQIHAHGCLQRKALIQTGNPTLFGEPTADLINISNWSKGDFFTVVDFSPAIVRRGAGGEHTLGRPVYMHAWVSGLRNLCVILGKDAEGSYWLSGGMFEHIWPRMEAELESVEKNF